MNSIQSTSDLAAAYDDWCESAPDANSQVFQEAFGVYLRSSHHDRGPWRTSNDLGQANRVYRRLAPKYQCLLTLLTSRPGQLHTEKDLQAELPDLTHPAISQAITATAKAAALEDRNMPFFVLAPPTKRAGAERLFVMLADTASVFSLATGVVPGAPRVK